MDLNLLTGLDALLQEESVTGAAKRMNLSVPAMSRMLARIRDTVGDPILVRAGSRLVPTPHALQLRGRVHAFIEEASRLLSPETGSPPPVSLARLFTVRTSDAFAGPFAARLLEIMQAVAPNIVLRIAPEGDEDVESLREGRIDLDLGVAGPTGPEIRVQTLHRDSFVGVMRAHHPTIHNEMTQERFCGLQHVSVSRRGRAQGPIDLILNRSHLARKVSLVVPSFYAALIAVAASDLVVAVPRVFAESALSFLPLHIFPLPVPVEPFVISQTWHPRFDSDPVHRWLRESVRTAFRKYVPQKNR